MSMIERVSAAIQAKCKERGYRGCPEPLIAHVAWAAMEAMREPDDTMRRAGGEYISEGTSMQCKQMIAETIWKVMVGAALRGEG